MNKIEDTLAHFGILGMKWGVRRKTGSDGRVISRSKIKSFDDRDAKRANARATRSNSGSIQKGKEAAHIFLKKVGDFGLPLLPVITISQGKQFGLGLGILSAGIKDKQVFIRETAVKLKAKKLYVESKKIT